MSIVTMSFFDHCNNEKQIIVNLQKGFVVARNANRQCIALTDFAFRLNVDNTTAKNIVHDTALEAAHAAKDKGIRAAREIMHKALGITFFVGIKG
ncbi:hypothetical protein bas22_0075 [Escherichia phage KurtStettler]|nr:hypothetical protein bas22_0075 [Escherichia phage KurtStettler]